MSWWNDFHANFGIEKKFGVDVEIEFDMEISISKDVKISVDTDVDVSVDGNQADVDFSILDIDIWGPAHTLVIATAEVEQATESQSFLYANTSNTESVISSNASGQNGTYTELDYDLLQIQGVGTSLSGYLTASADSV